MVFGGTGRAGDDGESATYADTHILDMRRPIPLWKEAPELDSSTAPSERNGFTLVPCGAEFVLFGGGVYGEAYYNDVHIFRLALQPKVSIPADTPHRSVALDLGGLLSAGTLTDCMLRGERGEGIAVHCAILHARCPALRSRLATAEAEARAQAAAGAEAAGAVDATVDVSMLFKGNLGCTDGDEVNGGRQVRRWPSALRSFVYYLYTGSVWPLPDDDWGCSADMDHPDYGTGQDPAYPQDNLGVVLMDRLNLLGKLAKPLCLPMLALVCQSEASGVFERVLLKAWKHPQTWERAGLVPSKDCEFAFDEYTRIECGASNYKKAIEIKGTANDAFRSGQYEIHRYHVNSIIFGLFWTIFD